MKRRTFIKGSATASILGFFGIGLKPDLTTLPKQPSITISEIAAEFKLTKHKLGLPVVTGDPQLFAEMVQKNQGAIAKAVQSNLRRNS